LLNIVVQMLVVVAEVVAAVPFLAVVFSWPVLVVRQLGL
jgi:hypothetical protein